MKRIATHLGLACALTLLASCAPSPSDTKAVQLAVSVPQALSASVTRVSVTAIAADFPAVSVDLAFANNSWGGTLGNLPAGSNRTFQAQAFDASGTLLFQGSASGVSIAAGQATLIAITLLQVNAPPPFQNAAPIIDSLAASAPSTTVSSGSTLSLAATAHDPNPSDSLSYAWSATTGSFSSTSSPSTSWTASNSPGIQTLTVTVTDSRGLSSSISLAVYVVPGAEQGSAQFSVSFNFSPQVNSLIASPARLAAGQTAAVTALASDSDGDSLSYSWSASCAGFWSNASSRSAQFTPSTLPPGVCNNCELTVWVSDSHGGQATGTISLCVSNISTTNHLNPVITTSSGSSGTAAPGQVLTFEVQALDPEGSTLSFSWANATGSLGTPANGASSSRISWTAPSCIAANTSPSLTATVTNAFNLTATQSFVITGLPVCATGWTSTAAMSSPRRYHAATLLPNGKVLVSGGQTSSGYLATAEVYDPGSGTWSATGSMLLARGRHTATLLNSGLVLITGGQNSSGTLQSAEVYNPASGTWSAAGLMSSPRQFHAATLLTNGKVLVAGGYNGSSIATAEVYDPAAGTWSAVPSMASAREGYTAALLPSGKVLVAGGYKNVTGFLGGAETYDAASGIWSATGSMVVPRCAHVSTLLTNGKVLVAGGQGSGGNLLSAEVYTPATGTWSATGAMASPRRDATMTLFPNGRVIVVGGLGSSGTIAVSEVYNPASGTWTTTSPLSSPRQDHTATLLNNGLVLVTGGYNGSSYLGTAELYAP